MNPRYNGNSQYSSYGQIGTKHVQNDQANMPGQIQNGQFNMLGQSNMPGQISFNTNIKGTQPPSISDQKIQYYINILRTRINNIVTSITLLKIKIGKCEIILSKQLKKINNHKKSFSRLVKDNVEYYGKLTYLELLYSNTNRTIENLNLILAIKEQSILSIENTQIIAYIK